MVAIVHVLHSVAAEVAGFLRIGHTGHRKLEALQAAGRLPFRRFVFDAAHIAEQAELLKALKANGCEIALDTNFAEMATIGRFDSSASKLSWANAERPWEPADFGRTRNLDIAKAIADFAVTWGVDTVLSPAHLVEAADDPWRAIDQQMAEAVRLELDRLGALGISIDYPLIVTSAVLKDERGRESLSERLTNLPIENVWLRTSGFGATSTGAGTRSFIEAVRLLHGIGRPLVADCAGGFAGLAAAAFGAVSGISHGVGQKEGFSASVWKRPSSGGGSSAPRVYIHELDRYLTKDQLHAVFAARGGRARFACNDTTCCQHGIEDMTDNSQNHFITQRARQLDDLSRVPEARRSEHFLLRHLDPAVRSARFAARLKVPDEKVAQAIGDAKSRLIRLRDALGDLLETEGTSTRSRPVVFRGRQIRPNAAMGR